MLNLYKSGGGKIAHSLSNLKKEDRYVWVDLFEPSDEEKAAISNHFDIKLPSRRQMHDLRFSKRFWHDKKTSKGIITVVTNSDASIPELHNIHISLMSDMLVTLRYSDPTPFEKTKSDILKEKNLNGQNVFSILIKNVISRITEVIIDLANDTMKLSQSIIETCGNNMEKVPSKVLNSLVCRINKIERLTSYSYQSLISVQQLIDFMAESDVTKNFDKDKKNIKNDIVQLIDNTRFLSGKHAFLLDSTLGIINIKQNYIMQILTIFAMIFMPPTLIASIYGMNFHFMPEINWRFGYAFSLFIMMIAGYIPYKVFKKRNWI